jgi:hypothetical protein
MKTFDQVIGGDKIVCRDVLPDFVQIPIRCVRQAKVVHVWLASPG